MLIWAIDTLGGLIRMRPWLNQVVAASESRIRKRLSLEDWQGAQPLAGRRGGRPNSRCATCLESFPRFTAAEVGRSQR